MVVVPLMVPLPVTLAPAATFRPAPPVGPRVPVTFRVPAVTWFSALLVLLPDKVKVPLPTLFRPPLPVTWPANTLSVLSPPRDSTVLTDRLAIPGPVRLPIDRLPPEFSTVPDAR